MQETGAFVVPSTATKIGNYRWTICALLFFATTINYLDRQVISLLKPQLEKEFNWKESDYASIVMGFQLAYAVGMVGAGWVIDKIGTKLGYAITLILWSIASILHAFATGLVSFIGFRVFLGVTEAGNFPAAIKTVAEWFPKKERALAAGIFNSGTNIGAIVAPLTVPLIALHLGWQMAFIITGAVGFIWLFFWAALYNAPSRHPKLSKAEYEYIQADTDKAIKPTDKASGPAVSWRSLLKYKQTWAFIAGKFLTDGVWWFFLFWLPAFLIAQYGLVGTQVGVPIAVVYTMAGVASIFGGWLPMWFIKTKGWTTAKARQVSMLIYAAFPITVIFSQAAGSVNMWFAVFIIGIAASAHQAWSANLFTTVSDMFPKQYVASVVGLGGMAGGLGGVLLSKSAGLLFDHYKSLGHIQTGYYIMFLFCGTAYLLAWTIMFRFLVPKMIPV